MADIDEIMSRHSDNYRFHGVREATLSRLVTQAENGNILLWGTDKDVHIDDDEYAEYQQGAGYLYTADITGWEICFDSFIDGGGMVLILEKQVDEPFEFEHPSDRRQKLIKVEEWKVVGGLRPVVDEDGEMVDQEAFSLEEIFAEFE